MHVECCVVDLRPHCCLYDKNVVVQIIVIMSNDDCCYDRSINLDDEKKKGHDKIVAHARS